MNGVTAEITQEIPVLLEDDNLDPRPGQEEP
jgi:hypothetical protein